jgi:hypothetical protein
LDIIDNYSIKGNPASYSFTQNVIVPHGHSVYPRYGKGGEGQTANASVSSNGTGGYFSIIEVIQ